MQRAPTHTAKIGDHAVIAALRAQEFLVGPISRPIALMIKEFVAAPEEVAKIADIVLDGQHLELAYEQFKNSA